MSEITRFTRSSELARWGELEGEYGGTQRSQNSNPFRQPHISRSTATRLSAGAVIVIGGLLALLYASAGHYRTALFVLPVCFGLWGFTEYVWSPLPRKLPLPLQWVLYLTILGGLIWFCFFR